MSREETGRADSEAVGPLPLRGVRVLEVAQIAAGPFCGMLLADMGADVVKLEPPQGDALRQWPPLRGGFSENFASLNRNKRSIALDLKDASDARIARSLALAADVLVENHRPGVMERLGLGYDFLSDRNTGLVYCSISAFGHTGPRSGQAAFDVTMQALSGIMSVTGEEGADPVKCGVPLSDFATGLYAAFNIAVALRERDRSGRGTHIDASMLGASLGIAALQTSQYFGTGRDPVKLGSRHPRNAPYQAFRASDRHFVLAAGNDRLWRSVCEVVGRPELVEDPRFRTTSDRAAHQEELQDLLQRRFQAATAGEWLERLEAAGVPCAGIRGYGEVLADPQVEAQGWLKTLPLPGGGRTRTVGAPIGMRGFEFPVRRGPPALDADRDEILAGLEREGEMAWPR